MPPQGKYARLTARLLALPAGQDGLRLSFAELAALAGPLPPGAWCSGYWRKSGVARVNWGRVAFVARLDRHHEAVTFVRAPETPPARTVRRAGR